MPHDFRAELTSAMSEFDEIFEQVGAAEQPTELLDHLDILDEQMAVLLQTWLQLETAAAGGDTSANMLISELHQRFAMCMDLHRQSNGFVEEVLKKYAEFSSLKFGMMH